MNVITNKIVVKSMLIAATVMRFIAYCVLVIFAIAALGCFVPSFPVLGSIGPLLVSPYGPWISILSLLGAVAVFRRWRATGKRSMLVLATLASFAALGTVTIQIQQISVAQQNGVNINVLRTLWLGEEAHESTAPIIRTYASYEGQDLPLAIYRPVNRSGNAAAPVLVYVHGGGWGGGTLHDRASDMRWFADQGYLIISVEYSLSAVDRHTWDIAERQVACALVWIADNAERFGGDGARLALFGESAGGNLVLNVSYRANAGLLNPICEGVLPQIAATIAGYPIIDALQMYQNNDVIAGRFARMMTTHYTGGTPAEYPERYAAISSYTHINSSAPPTLLLPGFADHLLPPELVFAFVKRARAAGVDARVIAFPYGEHSFDQRNGSIGSQLVRGAALQFLAEFGLAPSE
jgi:acetyl esterase